MYTGTGPTPRQTMDTLILLYYQRQSTYDLCVIHGSADHVFIRLALSELSRNKELSTLDPRNYRANHRALWVLYVGCAMKGIT